MILSLQYNRIKKFVLEKLEKELSPKLYYHNLFHTQEDVLPAAKLFALLEGIRGDDLYTLLISVLFHDIGYIEQYNCNEEIAVRMASEILPQFGVTPQHIEKISNIILATRMPQKPNDILEQIICDADLDSLGRADFFLISSNLKKEIGEFSTPIEDDVWLKRQLNFLESHKYFTESAKSIRDKSKQLNIINLKNMIRDYDLTIKNHSGILKNTDDESRKAFIRITDRFKEHINGLIRITEITDENIELMDKRVQFLKTNPLFKDCSSYDLLNMALYMEELEIPARTDLIIQSRPVDDVLFIKEGTVDVIVDGEFVVQRGAGSSVGEMSCLRGESFANATVRTGSTCKILKIPRQKFMNIVNLLPDIWKMLHKDMIFRLDEITNRFGELLRHTTQGLVKVSQNGKITSEISLIGMQYLGISEFKDHLFGLHVFSTDKEAKDNWDIFFPSLFQRPSEFETLSKNLPQQTNFIHPESGERKYFFYYYPCVDHQNNLVALDICIEDRTIQIKAALEIERARQEAERANKAKSEFLAKMSHEMRNPLTAVIGFSELSIDTSNLETTQKYSKLILNESKILLELINSLLDHSKIASGKLTLDNIAFDINNLMEEINCVMSIRTSQKNLEYLYEIDPDIAAGIMGDPGRLRQIFLNLIGNSIKFTEKGNISVRLKKVSESDDRITICFQVEDTGIGILEEHQSGIFESFTQADTSITRRFGGTGLGTTISKELVELMNGEIGLTSKYGQGSLFWFTINFPKAMDQKKFLQANVPIQNKPPIEVETQNTLKQFNARILVVEDYRINQIVARRDLEKLGCDVHIANNGQDAVSIVEKECFDLIFMDIEMPVMNGIEATRKIRSHELETKIRTPIVAMTGNVDEDHLKIFSEADMDDVLEKPFRLGQISAILEKWIGIKNGDCLADNINFSAQNVSIINIKSAAQNGLPSTDTTALRPSAQRVFDPFSAMIDFNMDLDTCKKMFFCFYTDNKDTVAAIQKAFDYQNWGELKSIAHSLKSTSGNIGAYALSDLSSKVETRCKTTGNPPEKEQIEKLTFSINQIMDALKEMDFFSESELTCQSKPEMDKKQLGMEISMFIDTIEFDDIETIQNRFDDISRYLEESYVLKLKKFLATYDFNEAIETLRNIAQEYEIEL
ncbi:MAG: response regulator [Desulfamplus sp.]|nr:response regulator [Desulfamplus sp.]